MPFVLVPILWALCGWDAAMIYLTGASPLDSLLVKGDT